MAKKEAIEKVDYHAGKVGCVVPKTDKVKDWKHYAYDLARTSLDNTGDLTRLVTGKDISNMVVDSAIGADKYYSSHAGLHGVFRCLVCGRPMKLRKSGKYTWYEHIKETKQSDDDIVNTDGIIHRVIKDKIRYAGIEVPPVLLKDLKSKQGRFEANAKYAERVVRMGGAYQVTRYMNEVSITSGGRVYRLDGVGTIGNRTCAIEVTDTHATSEDKIQAIKGRFDMGIEVIVHRNSEGDMITHTESKWMWNYTDERALYESIWMMCPHAELSEVSGVDEFGRKYRDLYCKKLSVQEDLSPDNNNKIHEEVIKKRNSCRANFFVDCKNCPSYFGVDHEPTKDMCQCIGIKSGKDAGFFRIDEVIDKLSKVYGI